MTGITVIIATYNRAELLRGALRAIAQQQDPGGGVQVIVADNGSTDDTRAVFEQASAARPEFDWCYLCEGRPGKSFAVNAALEQAQGKWLVFTDDDVRPERGWLSAIADAFGRTDADFVVGRILPLWEREAPPWLTPPLYGVLGIPDNGDTPQGIQIGRNDHIMPIGANMAVQRRVVSRLGGLSPELGKMRGTLRTGEDHEFYLRLLNANCRGVYVPAARVQHIVPADRLERAYFRQWLYENGRNVATLEAGYPVHLPMLLGVPRYKWRKAAQDAWRLVRAAARFDAPERFASALALLWFAGYVRQRWFGNGLGQTASPAIGVGVKTTAERASKAQVRA